MALLVSDYDQAIEFYTRKLHFTLIEDTFYPEQDKRWVVIAPPGSNGTSVVLARASTELQRRFVGDQAGGRVFLFMQTDDFKRDYQDMKAQGIHFAREPHQEPYGTVAVFVDLYGNRWDLIEYKDYEREETAWPRWLTETRAGPHWRTWNPVKTAPRPKRRESTTRSS